MYVLADADQAAESCTTGVKTSEFISSSGQEPFGSTSNVAAVTGNAEIVSLKQDKAADVDGDQLSDDGQDNRVGCKDEDKSLSHRGESEEDDDPATVSHEQTTRRTRLEQRASCVEYVVVETHQLPSGDTSTQKYYKCPTCEWRTKHVGFFTRHLRVSHDDGRAWTCDQCAFTCTSKKHMTKHRNTHTRPFLCQYCSVRYSEQRELERHIWKHKGRLRTSLDRPSAGNFLVPELRQLRKLRSSE